MPEISRYVVFDKKGIIHESGSHKDAFDEYFKTNDFCGDLYLCKILDVRR